METSKFFGLLFLTIGLILGIMYFLTFNDKISGYTDIAKYAIPAFTILCVNVFFVTKMLDKGKKKNGLMNVIILNVLIKFILAIGVVYIYHKNENPEDGGFVLPFIIIYVIFTVFETYFMSVQAKRI